MILNIYSGIALPWGFVNQVTAPALARLTKKMITYLAQISKANVSCILLHLRKYVFYFSHVNYSISTGIIVKGCLSMEVTEEYSVFRPVRAAFWGAPFFKLLLYFYSHR